MLGRCQREPSCEGPCGRLVSLWDPDLLSKISKHDRVSRVVALGEQTLLLEVRGPLLHLVRF
jgi:hypothetical protein